MAQDLAAHIPMVERMARRYRGTPLGVDDAIGTGLLALVEADTTFDPSLDVPFGAYAHQKVKWAMSEACRSYNATKRFNDMFFVASEEDIIDVLVCNDQYTDIPDQIMALPDRDRCITLLLYAGFGMKEIACYYGISESRVSQLFKKVKVKLANN